MRKEIIESIYFDPDYKNIVQFKHACLNDLIHRDENTTLDKCDCAYHQKYNLPCWHMQQLALKSGIYDKKFQDGSYLLPSISALSDGAFKVLGNRLYYGYYDSPIEEKKLGRYKSVIIKSGLVTETNGTLFYSCDVKNNIYFMIFTFFTDKRIKDIL